VDFDSLRSKYPGYSDDEILGALQATKYPDYSVDELKAALGWKPVKRSAFAAVNDTVIEGANAVAGGVKAVGDFIAPGNAVSSFIDENIIKAGEAKQSDEVKAEKARLASEVQNADGMLGEAGAALGYVARNPVLAAAQAAGSFVVPGAAIKGAGLVGRAAGIGAGAAGLGGGVLAGAALSGGDAAGQAYELAKRAGASEEEAVAAARQASVIPAAVGGATGAFGAERVFAGAKGYAGGAASRALKTGASEAAQEALEEGVTQYEAQRAAMPYDPSIDPMKGVASAATLGAALGGITGAGVGMLSGAAETKRDPVPDILDAPDIDAALKAATDGVFGKGEGLPLPDTEVTPEQALMRIEAEAQRANRQNVNDWSILGGERAPAESEADWLQEARALAQADQQQIADEQRIRAEALAPAAPTGDAALPVIDDGKTFERTLGDIAFDADRARAEAQKAAEVEAIPALAAEQNVQQAAVQRAATLEGESPLAAALRRATMEKAGAAVAQKLDSAAGSNPQAVGDGQSQPAAPAAPEPRIVERTADMRPMSKLGAETQAAKNGGEVVRIPNRQPGKFAYTVLAPQQEQRGNDAAGTGATGVADAGRGDGTALVPEQRPGDIQPGAASVAGEGVGSVGPAGALTVGTMFEQNGKAWTVTEANDRMIRAQDADGNKRMIAVGSKAYTAITEAAAPAKVAVGLSGSDGAPSAPVAAAPDKMTDSRRAKLLAEQRESRGPAASEAWVNAGKTPEQLAAERADYLGRELAGTTREESSQKDFAPSELPAAVRMWAEQERVPEDQLRAGFLKHLDSFDFSDGRKAQIRAAFAKAPNTTPRSADAVATKDSGGVSGPPDPGEHPASLGDRLQKRKTDLASEVKRNTNPFMQRLDALRALRSCLNG
jgi:hypothetical protein